MSLRTIKVTALLAAVIFHIGCGRSETPTKSVKDAAETLSSAELLHAVSGSETKSLDELAAMTQAEFIAHMIEMVETMIAELESGEGSFERPVNLEEFVEHLKDHLQRLKSDTEYQQQIYEDFREMINNPPELPDGVDGALPPADTLTEI